VPSSKIVGILTFLADAGIESALQMLRACRLDVELKPACIGAQLKSLLHRDRHALKAEG
jgi:hypothetical protein